MGAFNDNDALSLQDFLLCKYLCLVTWENNDGYDTEIL